jgi:hypothetical protein
MLSDKLLKFKTKDNALKPQAGHHRDRVKDLQDSFEMYDLMTVLNTGKMPEQNRHLPINH